MNTHAFHKTALVLIDMQNDFLHPQGAYARSGLHSEMIANLPAKLKLVANAVRAGGGWIVSTHFTLVAGKGGTPFINKHLKALRPFLKKGDFVPGSFGHSLIDELTPADLSIEKVTYSAFYMSRLEWVLNQFGISRIIVGGIVTNGGVASTVRDAHIRGYDTWVLSDGCAAFDSDLHEVSIEALKSVARIYSCAEAIDEFRA